MSENTIAKEKKQGCVDKCLEMMKKNSIKDQEEIKEAILTAKKTLEYLASHKIPIIPANYNIFFYIICKLKKEGHIVSDKNIQTMYEKYFKDKSLENEKDVAIASSVLLEISFDFDKISERLEENASKQSEYIQESVKAMHDKDDKKLLEIEEKMQSLQEENRVLRKLLEQSNARLKMLQSNFNKVKELSEVDHLTGVYNKRMFEHDIAALDKFDFALIMLDLDDFKKINDTYGHSAGDAVLKEVGKILTTYIRGNTRVYRTGGEEFTILLPYEKESAGEVVANRLRNVISTNIIATEDNEGNTQYISITGSFGVSAKKEPEEDPIRVIRRADQAVYEAKRLGKDRVVVNMDY